MEDAIRVHIDTRLLMLHQDIKDARKAMKKDSINRAIGALTDDDKHIAEVIHLLKTLRQFKNGKP